MDLREFKHGDMIEQTATMTYDEAYFLKTVIENQLWRQNLIPGTNLTVTFPKRIKQYIIENEEK